MKHGKGSKEKLITFLSSQPPLCSIKTSQIEVATKLPHAYLQRQLPLLLTQAEEVRWQRDAAWIIPEFPSALKMSLHEPHKVTSHTDRSAITGSRHPRGGKMQNIKFVHK